MSVSNRILPRIERPAAQAASAAEALQQELGCPRFVAEILHQRGIQSVDDARVFFAPVLPVDGGDSEMLGLSGALPLLLAACRQGEKIAVFGDYDVDGIAGAAVLCLGLRALGAVVEGHLPTRFGEGYGLTEDRLRVIAAGGAKWLVTVDTGVSAVREVEMARALGLRVIITDHHQVQGELPAAEAVINPQRPGCPYPNKSLCGAGVAFRLVNRLWLEALGRPADVLLDLVALGTLADVVQLGPENRALVHAGLALIAGRPRPGLAVLLRSLGLEGRPLATSDILFRVVPLLNASGRMRSPDQVLELLLEEDETRARAIVEDLHILNQERRTLERAAFDEARAQVDAPGGERNAPCLVVASETWHEGIIGIVAAKLAEEYGRPAFVLSVKNGAARGSGRSVEGFQLHQALTACQDLFEKWGGHQAACGFSLPSARIEELRGRLHEAAGRQALTTGQARRLRPQTGARLQDIDAGALEWLRRFEPFGPGNDPVLLYAGGLRATSVRVLSGEHLKLEVTDGTTKRDAVGFGLAAAADLVGPDKKFGAAFHPEWNEFRGRRTIQLRITGLEPSET